MNYKHRVAEYINNRMNKLCPRGELEQIALTYSIEVWINNLLKIVIIMLLAGILGITTRSLIIIVIFASLRRYAGGVHCEENWTCVIITSFIVIGGALFSTLQVQVISPIIWCVFYLLGAIGLYKYAPSATKINPISEKEKKVLKKKTMLIYGIYVIIAILMRNNGFRAIVLWTAYCELVTLLPVVNRKYQEN